MPAIRDRSSSARSRRSSSACSSRSSSARIGRKGSWSCPSAGLWSAPSLGSGAAAGWPRIGRTSTAERSPSCASPPSASCSDSSAILHNLSGQTLKNPTDEELDREMDVLGDIEFEMHACPARTWTGVAIKAAVARTYLLEFYSSSLDTAATKALFEAIAAHAGRV